MRKFISGTCLLGLALALGCGGSDVVYHDGYELTRQEQANNAAFNATRDLEHAKEAEDADPRNRKNKAKSASRNYGR